MARAYANLHSLGTTGVLSCITFDNNDFSELLEHS